MAVFYIVFLKTFIICRQHTAICHKETGYKPDGCDQKNHIWQGIQRERLMLMGLRDRADYVIDTTDMLPQKLRSTIRGLFATGSERKQPQPEA